MPTDDSFDLTPEQEDHATRLHAESELVDALVAGTDYLDDPEYRDHLVNGGVTAGNLTVGGPSDDFSATVEGVVDVRKKVRANDDRFLVAETVEDIHRAQDTDRVGIVLGFQGGAPVGKNLDRLRAFDRLGVRVIGLTYNRANYLGSGCCEPRDGGLTMLGRDVVDEMNDRGIVIDTAHDGDRTTMDVVEYSEDPVIQSHIGCRALCPARGRAKTDEQLRAVADGGGVNAITPFPPVVKRDPDTHEVQRATVHDVLDHVDHAVDVAGVDHVGFGADMSDKALDRGTMSDGSNLKTWRPTHPEVYGRGSTTEMDPYPEGLDRYHRLQNLTRGLVSRGYSDGEVEKILGGNLLRVFDEVWE
jgi:membrane dipeptidase